jgi:MYXO-CTERM domain-containing protein
MRVRRWIPGLLGVATLLSAAAVPANGRFPEAQKLIEDPRDPNRLLLAATYGLLVTRDRGQNWHYLCEQAFALELVEGDPLLELLPDGALLSGITASLTRSADCGCSWSSALAQADPEYLRDVTVEKSGSRAVIALTRDIGKTPDVFSISQSTDSGKSWTKIGDLPAQVEEAFTIDSAPSDASRLYASALMTDLKGALLVSSDRGATWETRVFDGADIDNQAYIAAVHPTNPDIVFVRTNGWDDESYANDALFSTSDAGRTWRELIRKPGKLFGFALSPDGSKVLAGYGDPYQAASFTDPAELGLYAADTAQGNFTKIFFGAVSCITWTNQGLYTCNAEGVPDVGVEFTLGFAPNADFTIDTPNPFTPLLLLKDVRGPLGCAAAVCGDDWSMPSELGPAVCERLGANCNGAASDPEPCDNPQPTGGSGGTGGTGGTGAGGTATGGTAGSGGTSGAGGSAGIGGATQGSGPGAGGGSGGGCGCRTAAAPTAFSALLLVLGTAPFWRVRRRSR